MKKKIIATILCAGLAASMLAACGKKEDVPQDAVSEIAKPIEDQTSNDDAAEEQPVEEETEQTLPVDNILRNENAPEGYVYSELSGELIDASLMNQRPIGAMVDNELTALDHYGLNDADIIYEMMNSTENNRITRLFVLMKDWSKIERLGSIRSTRTTNCILTAEWNCVLCHDGGPGVFIDKYIALDSVDHISGVFSRIENGKPREFTEYITKDDLEKYLVNSSISTEYNDYYTGPHFEFAPENAMALRNFTSEPTPAEEEIILPFPHNASELHYNKETGFYEYYEYGKPHVDAETGEVLAFRNVILQRATFSEGGLGYMWYNIAGEGEAYFITEGKCAPVKWAKDYTLEANTQFYDRNMYNIILNVGKTYIGIIPDDTWDTMTIK